MADGGIEKVTPPSQEIQTVTSPGLAHKHHYKLQATSEAVLLIHFRLTTLSQLQNFDL
jgi:hypothetical protein